VTVDPGTSEPISAEPDMSLLLSGLARETAQAAESCTVLQWSVSTLLDKVHHPDLGAEIHMLQDIDRMQQTLADVSAILTALSPNLAGVAVCCDDLAAVIRLESLRQRLQVAVGLTAAADHEHPPNDDEVTWL